MKNTENFNFKLPEPTDIYNIENFNDNMKTIDTLLAGAIKVSTFTKTIVGNVSAITTTGAEKFYLYPTFTDGYTLVGVVGVSIKECYKVVISGFEVFQGVNNQGVNYTGIGVTVQNRSGEDLSEITITVRYIEVKTELLG